MKLFTLIFFVFLSANLVAQQKKVNAFTLKGKIQNASKMKLYLAEGKKVSGSTYQDSTTTDEAGNFSFTGVVSEPRLFVLTIAGSKHVKDRLDVVVENNSSISVAGNADSLYKAEVKGSKEDLLLKTFAKYFNANLETVSKEIYKSYLEAKSKNDTAAMLREGATADQKAKDEVSEMITNFVNEHPSSAVSIELIEMLFKYERISTADSLLHKVEKTAAGKYAAAQQLRKNLNIQRSLSVGAIAPDFTQPDTSGHFVSLSSLRGKYVLVDFWASWCAPCRAENPNVLSAYQRFKDQNFTILAISMDKDRKSWINAIQEDHLPWAQLSDLKGFDNQAGKLYAITAIPMNYLIDPAGKIIALNLRGENLNKKLQEFLK